ncbi:GNAT family N-acetyltransferase [Photobacterium galatheae]|uniref:GCN5 family acetyltransferase n=1 Tax=Photobacterium galatheae TaxID=1654360 RepID=A0A066RX86_9GAMM|nr:GNAT family N-acetyltransferase [Photobacterium galatheae]KDM92292.1 GCN5 family acetyltransferase [Photobacterium galatheae]MCM0150527.1 GNAT family N-acetyltransferase [Photobacterium galatheae]
MELQTPRLIIRPWKAADLVPFAAMSADPAVMRYFPSTLTEEESQQAADRAQSLIEEKGWGFWAVELKETGAFIGFVGLHYQDSEIPNAPFIEIGWRLASEYWGRGLAPEAAERALQFAFDELNASDVYAFTALPNQPSQRVMQKLGMTDCQQNFLHPKLPADHPLAEHCLYRISRTEWLVSS